MRLQLLSDLHLETEAFDPEPAPGAELLVLAGDIDSTWDGFARFRGWPVPVLFVAGNHEFDDRELTTAWPALRARCADLGLHAARARERWCWPARDGRRIRFVGTTRWCDFDLFGAAQRERAMRAGGYFMRRARATRDGRPFDAAAVRAEALACRDWLAAELARPRGSWDAHGRRHPLRARACAAPTRATARSRGTASFCNADDDLLPRADLWLHGHLHCRHDYRVRARRRRDARRLQRARPRRRGEAEGIDRGS